MKQHFDPLRRKYGGNILGDDDVISTLQQKFILLCSFNKTQLEKFASNILGKMRSLTLKYLDLFHLNLARTKVNKSEQFSGRN